MPFADVQGQRIHYEDSGGKGLPIVLAHGFPLDSRAFEPLLGALTPEFRVIRWDQRGFGSTVWDGAPYTFWDSARDCLGLLDELHVKQSVVGGMSQGGFVALRVALSQPSRVKALLLFTTCAGLDPEPSRAALRKTAADWAAGGSEELARELSEEVFGTSQAGERWVKSFRELPPKSVAQALETSAGREDLVGRLGQIGCPALVVHGTEARSIPVALGEQLRHGLRGAAATELVAIEGAAHAPCLSHPDQVSGPLLSFLRGLPVR